MRTACGPLATLQRDFYRAGAAARAAGGTRHALVLEILMYPFVHCGFCAPMRTACAKARAGRRNQFGSM